jgi:hypothetical protein
MLVVRTLKSRSKELQAPTRLLHVSPNSLLTLCTQKNSSLVVRTLKTPLLHTPKNFHHDLHDPQTHHRDPKILRDQAFFFLVFNNEEQKNVANRRVIDNIKKPLFDVKTLLRRS